MGEGRDIMKMSVWLEFKGRRGGKAVSPNDKIFICAFGDGPLLLLLRVNLNKCDTLKYDKLNQSKFLKNLMNHWNWLK